MAHKKPTDKPTTNLPTTPQSKAEREHLSDLDIHLFREGSHYRLYEKLGAHRIVLDGKEGVFFAVWAPGAESVSVLADFNGWSPGSNPLHPPLGRLWNLGGVHPGRPHGHALQVRFRSASSCRRSSGSCATCA